MLRKRLANGWAIAIYNESNGEVFLSRDRFGVKPLLIWIKREAIFFASELKSLRKLPSKYQLPASNQVLLFLYKRPDNSSQINSELSHLPAGHSLRFTANKKAIFKRWWRPLKPSIKDKSYPELTEEFRFIFFDALKLRTQDQSPKCTALSGGLDSSSVFCATQQLIANREIKTNYPHKAFTLDYSNTPSSELNYALEVTKTTKSEHTLIRLSPDSSIITPELLRDCIYSSEQINHLFLGPFLLYRAMSKEGYKVSVDGHGADELLAGYKKFARASIQDCIKQSSSDSDLIEIKKLWINAGVSPNEINAAAVAPSVQAGELKFTKTINNLTVNLHITGPNIDADEAVGYAMVYKTGEEPMRRKESYNSVTTSDMPDHAGAISSQTGLSSATILLRERDEMLPKIEYFSNALFQMVGDVSNVCKIDEYKRYCKRDLLYFGKDGEFMRDMSEWWTNVKRLLIIVYVKMLLKEQKF